MSRTFLFCLLLIYGCKPQTNGITICTDPIAAQNATKISIRELAQSKELNGKTVTIQGIFSYNFEDIAIYANKNDKGVWVDGQIFSSENDSLLKKLNGRRIIATGTLDFSSKGHLGLYLCTLTNVFCVRQ